MRTPDPRLISRRSREPNISSCPPRKYWKNGSFAKGEFGVRTVRTDEILTTPLVACAAMAVKSGRLVSVGAAAVVREAGVADPGASATCTALILERVCTRP